MMEIEVKVADRLTPCLRDFVMKRWAEIWAARLLREATLPENMVWNLDYVACVMCLRWWGVEFLKDGICPLCEFREENSRRSVLIQTASEEGKRRWMPYGIYDDKYACTCTPTCPKPCKGDCGCDACSTAYGDYLSTPGV